MEIRENHSRDGRNDFSDVVSKAIVARGSLAPVHQFLFAEDLDAGSGSCEADGESYEECHLRDRPIVDGGGEHIIGRVKNTDEVLAFLVELGQTNEETRHGADTQLEEKRRFHAVLLDNGAHKAKVYLAPEWCTARFDRRGQRVHFGHGWSGNFVGVLSLRFL